ncbi:MAG: hypothetical protein QW459_05150 [Sulfolobales archaeon]
MPGYGESLSREEKLRLLRALEEDAEFRYAVAGAIGVLELLRRLDTIEKNVERLISVVQEHSRRLEELTRTVEEHSKRLEELTRVVGELSKRLEELTRIVEVHSKTIQEHSRRLEELTRTVKEHSIRLEELTTVVTRLVERASALEQVTGALTEASVARYVFEDIAREASSRGERVLRRVRNARLNEVDIDLLVESDRRVYVVEVKVRPKHRDVDSILGKLDVVRKHYPEKEVAGVLAGVWIGREVEEYAREKGIVTYAY